MDLKEWGGYLEDGIWFPLFEDSTCSALGVIGHECVGWGPRPIRKYRR